MAAASLIISAIGTGISAYGQTQQAQAATDVANYNAQVQENNSQLQAEIAMRNAQYQAQGAQYSAQAAMAQNQAQLNNAAMLEAQARSVEDASRIAADQRRAENERLLAKQRARFASAGVVSSEGTPLAVLADTAGRLELGVQNDLYEAGLQSRELDWRAKLERYNAGFSLLDARMDEYGGDVALWRGDIAQLGAAQSASEADFIRWSGASEAAGYNLGATGSLIAGAATMTSAGYDFYNKGAFGGGSGSIPGAYYTPGTRVRRAKAV